MRPNRGSAVTSPARQTTGTNQLNKQSFRWSRARHETHKQKRHQQRIVDSSLSFPRTKTQLRTTATKNVKKRDTRRKPTSNTANIMATKSPKCKQTNSENKLEDETEQQDYWENKHNNPNLTNMFWKQSSAASDKKTKTRMI